jgi:hypothetical protein
MKIYQQHTTFKGYNYVKRNNSILHSTYNKKRLDAFIAWEEIFEFMNSKYKIIIDEVIACFTYWVIDNIIYVLDQVDDAKIRNIYLSIIKRNVKSRYKNIITSKKLSSYHKGFITLLSLNVNFLSLLYLIKKSCFNNV